MKRQAIVTYHDGGQTKVTNSTEQSLDIILNYLHGLSPRSLKEVIIKQYPLKNNETLQIIKDGKVVNNLPQWNMRYFEGLEDADGNEISNPYNDGV